MELRPYIMDMIPLPEDHIARIRVSHIAVLLPPVEYNSFMIVSVNGLNIPGIKVFILENIKSLVMGVYLTRLRRIDINGKMDSNIKNAA